MTRIVFSRMELPHIHHDLQEIRVASSFSDTPDGSLDLASDTIDDSRYTIIDSIAEIIVIVDRPDDSIVWELAIDDRLMSTHILHIVESSLIARCSTDRIRTVDIVSTTCDGSSDQIRAPVKIITHTRIPLRRELYCHPGSDPERDRPSNIVYLSTMVDSTYTRLEESGIHRDIGMQKCSLSRYCGLE